jgi:hypothetical protein
VVIGIVLAGPDSRLGDDVLVGTHRLLFAGIANVASA